MHPIWAWYLVTSRLEQLEEEAARNRLARIAEDRPAPTPRAHGPRAWTVRLPGAALTFSIGKAARR